MATQQNQTQESKATTTGIAPIPTDENETETLSADAAMEQAAVLAQSYTVDDVKAAATSYRRATLRRGLKARFTPQS